MLTALQKAEWRNSAPYEGLEQRLNQKRGVLKAVWDFAVQGGAVSTLALLDENGDAALLPDNAIVVQCYVDVITAMASAGGAGTLALDSEGAGDLLGAVDADTLSGVNAGIPVGSAATMIKLTAQRQVSMTIAVEALTAGKISVFVEFVLSD